MRTKLVAGNWKMHGGLVANRRLLEALKSHAPALQSVRCAVCVPFPYLQQVSELLADCALQWGAQNLSEYDAGAFTGEVSGAMLREFGCRYVLTGHSERRQLYGETNAQVAAKFIAAQKVGLIPILCVGETLQQREQNATEAVIGAQLDAVIEAAGIGAFDKDRAVVAYEPVWAIGTGRNATPEQAQAVHAFLRSRVVTHSAEVANELTLLYGGSVKPENAAALFAMPDVDGGLVGGAALVAQDFIAICAAARMD
jgi:triosephosphate isomerase